MRLLRHVLAAALLVVLVGCTSVIGGSGTSTGSTSPPPPLPPDQLVLRIEYSPGYAPPDYYLANTPAISVYGDGRIYEVVHRSGTPLSPDIRYAEVDPAEVSALVAKIERSGLLKASTDYGFPQITDLGDTLLTLHGDGVEQQVSVYALQIDSADEQLTATQADNRQRLRDRIDEVYELAEGGSSIAPDVVEVVDAGVPTDPVSASREWPGPDLATLLTDTKKTYGSTFACGSITGPEASALWTAAAATDDHTWLVNAEPRRLIVNPVFPGDPPCS